MSNHIAAKFLTVLYSPIPKEKFEQMIPTLEDALRTKLPRYKRSEINGIQVDLIGDTISTKQEIHTQELHMIDAEGLWGIKIGNNGISFSTSKYVTYEESILYVKSVFEIISAILNISHFSQVSLRNINLFKQSSDAINQYEDIKDKKYWGSQHFDTLATNFICAGAATRHEYFHNDWLKHIQLISGVVLIGQSYIPQEEWNIWSLRGKIPTSEAENTQLLVDICSTRLESPANLPERKVTEYSWDCIEQRFGEIHMFVNNVYMDITQDN